MADKRERNTANLDPEKQKRIARARRERKRRKRRKVLTLRAVTLGVLIVVLIGCIIGVSFGVRKAQQKRAEKRAEQEQLIQAEEKKNAARQDKIEEAAKVARGYDFDKSIELLKSIENYDKDANIITSMAKYEADKSTLTSKSIDQVTHIFYHSLVVDPDKAFAGNDSKAAGFAQWMTTVDEFNAITRQMYDNGYVLVSLHDLVDQTVDADGTVHFTKGKIMLPEDKTPFVMSLDDLSYYHSYDNRGIASKMIIGEDGKPTCEYIEDDGSVVTGAYDCVPLLDQFIEEHPDASYHGAKGMIALTGYNGILGYRTDISYKNQENLSEDQQAWLAANPDFDWQKDCNEATRVAEAMKADGWEFANHTWGHIRVGDSSLETIQADTEKWMSYVSPLIGGTDTIIFAHGQDLSDWHDYTMDNPKFSYLKSKGFNIYCNVDSAPYFVQVRDSYLRQGRRNLDGYRLWNDVHGEKNRTSDLFDAVKVLDPRRKDVPAL